MQEIIDATAVLAVTLLTAWHRGWHFLWMRGWRSLMERQGEWRRRMLVIVHWSKGLRWGRHAIVRMSVFIHVGRLMVLGVRLRLLLLHTIRAHRRSRMKLMRRVRGGCGSAGEAHGVLRSS